MLLIIRVIMTSSLLVDMLPSSHQRQQQRERDNAALHRHSRRARAPKRLVVEVGYVNAQTAHQKLANYHTYISVVCVIWLGTGFSKHRHTNPLSACDVAVDCNFLIRTASEPPLLRPHASHLSMCQNVFYFNVCVCVARTGTSVVQVRARALCVT